MDKKAFGLVLHSHLPWVLSHGVWPHGAEWLFEAASETYIPLIRVFKRLMSEGIKPNVTVGLTPVLVEQLSDDEFKAEFPNYLVSKAESARADLLEFEKAGLNNRAKVARMWIEFYEGAMAYFDEINRDIVSEFKQLQDEGAIEIITSAATHGYLPLLGLDEAVRAQVEVGVRNYIRVFGKKPIGIWPPELAYRPAYRWKAPVGDYPEIDRRGVEEFYHDSGIRYFIVDKHLLMGGEVIGTYLSLFEGLKALWERSREAAQFRSRKLSPHKPYYAASGNSSKPVAFFTRDPETASRVWSRDLGYPGDPAYLEFHKRHFPGGHKYWRVTDSKLDLADKGEYIPEMVEAPLEAQSSHFVQLVNEIAVREDGIVVAPFDTELFGHWWFEGPEWLYRVIKKLYSDKSDVRPVKLGEYLDAFPPDEVVNLPEGSWGEGGFHWVWLNDWTRWTWEKIYEMEHRVVALLKSDRQINPLLMQQILKQLLLLESSDWQFLITTWSARDYAENRFSEHYEVLKKLLDMAETGLTEEDMAFVKTVASKDRLFNSIVSPEFWKLKG